jgi:hypothetical protein
MRELCAFWTLDSRFRPDCYLKRYASSGTRQFPSVFSGAVVRRSLQSTTYNTDAMSKMQDSDIAAPFLRNPSLGERGTMVSSLRPMESPTAAQTRHARH